MRLQSVMWVSPEEGFWVLQARWIELDPIQGEVHRISGVSDFEEGYGPVTQEEEEGEGWKES